MMVEMKFLNKKQNFTLAAQRAYQPELESHSVSTGSSTVQKNKKILKPTNQLNKQQKKINKI